MAEKGFGVKEINLIGASGTPTIESPNNLNLNAVNVAISTNVSIGGTLTVSGNVSVGGTLTYEDVTNIDSVGLITARSGLIASGISTFSETVNFTRSGTAIDITQGELEIGGGIIRRDGKLRLWFYDAKDSWYYAGNVSNGAIGEHKFKVVNTDKFIISNTGVNVSGICTATTFSGSGASLTNVPAADPTATDVQVAYELLSTSASGAGWRITGNGIVNTVNNPDLYLIRGQKYRFINNSGGSHPFRIQSDSSTAYGTGVTNNNASSGNIDFVPRNDAPARLYYNCTNHGGMLGNLYLRDAAGGNTKVGVSTFSGKVTIEGTTSPTFNKGNFGPGSLTLQNNSNDGTIDYSQGIVFTDNANNNADGGWVHAAIVCTGSTGYNGNIIFGVDGNGNENNNLSGITEKLRITNSGTVTNSQSMNAPTSGSGWGFTTDQLYLSTNGTSANYALRFYNDNGLVGSALVNGSSTTFNTSSDYRLKENEVIISDGIVRLKKLKPYKFNFKKDPNLKVDGFFAHEVSSVVPESVTGTKDQIADADDFNNGLANAVGDPVYQQIDQSKLIPLLTAALQEAVTKIEALEAEVAALKGS